MSFLEDNPPNLVPTRALPHETLEDFLEARGDDIIEAETVQSGDIAYNFFLLNCPSCRAYHIVMAVTYNNSMDIVLASIGAYSQVEPNQQTKPGAPSKWINETGARVDFAEFVDHTRDLEKHISENVDMLYDEIAEAWNNDTSSEAVLAREAATRLSKRQVVDVARYAGYHRFYLDALQSNGGGLLGLLKSLMDELGLDPDDLENEDEDSDIGSLGWLRN